VYAVVIGALLVITALAILVPALRAATLDSAATLRAE
jgi:ABC-type lipoprotein release transport system permease subunit